MTTTMEVDTDDAPLLRRMLENERARRDAERASATITMPQESARVSEHRNFAAFLAEAHGIEVAEASAVLRACRSDDEAADRWIKTQQAKGLPLLPVDLDGSIAEKAREAEEDSLGLEHWRTEDEQLQTEVATAAAIVQVSERQLSDDRAKYNAVRDRLVAVRKIEARFVAKAQAEAERRRVQRRPVDVDDPRCALAGLLAEEFGCSLLNAQRALVKTDGDEIAAEALLRERGYTRQPKAAAVESPSTRD